ncbi:MAGE-domain-containing protein [Basidiobolus meristosporus CBS 931.73]|uniref:MAGE-domain-containing protein n=1 Tax=Basidiobolus meristosporus CBS 931.73 TaxID=1314790 RepID=A0A1Y1Z083_9FUNG|nr:MAGE-domain-containing protein [Basidiobolus meristosporus CBS 931.73]|eukprot:ORY03619.1 MAGE-domain-containing protein [Basidiobolus meristosporus CBS 931.73]
MEDEDDINDYSSHSQSYDTPTNSQFRKDTLDDEEDYGSQTQAEPSRYRLAEKAAQNLSPEVVLFRFHPELERKVKDVVRLALCTEFRKAPLKREDINRRVLHEHSRIFHLVFDKAQEKLRETFGMELVELPNKEKFNNGGRKGKDKQATKAYILRNILPVQEGFINWGKDRKQMGLIMVILSLILVNNRVLSDDQLKHSLRRLSICEGVEHAEFGDIDQLVTQFIKQGYLDKSQVNHVDFSSQSNEIPSYEYRWGPRAKVELTEINVLNFITEIFGKKGDPHMLSALEKTIGEKLKH